MMTLISLAISVAFGFSAAVTLGFAGTTLWEELATLVTIMLLGHWIEMRSINQASVGAPPLGTEANFDVNGVMTTGKTIRGIIEGDSVPDLFIPSLIQLYSQGRFPFDKLVKFYTLDQINQAVHDSEKGITIKPVVRIGA